MCSYIQRRKPKAYMLHEHVEAKEEAELHKCEKCIEKGTSTKDKSYPHTKLNKGACVHSNCCDVILCKDFNQFLSYITWCSCQIDFHLSARGRLRTPCELRDISIFMYSCVYLINCLPVVVVVVSLACFFRLFLKRSCINSANSSSQRKG